MANPHETDDSAGAPEGRAAEVDCGAALLELYRYLDGELPARDHHLIGRHLQDCAGCLSQFDFEQVLLRLVRLHLADAHRMPPPPTLVARVTLSMQSEAPQLPGSAPPGSRFLGPNLPGDGLNRPK